MDILAEVSTISETFQTANILLQEVGETVDVHVKELRQQVSNGQDGSILQLRKDVTQVNQDEDVESSGDVLYRGVDLDGNLAHVERVLTRERSAIMSSLLEKLQERFADFSEDPVLSSCEVFDHTTWPEEESELSAYGIEEVYMLLDHFQIPPENQGVDLVSAKQEWD